GALNGAQGGRVTFGIERVNRNRRRIMFAGSSDLVVTRIAPVADPQQFSLHIDSNAVNVGQSGLLTFDDPQRLFISGRALSEYQYARRVLVCGVNLLLLFVDGDLETPMRNVENANGLGISLGAGTIGIYRVRGIHRHVVSLAVLGVDVDAVVVLILRVGTFDHTLRRGGLDVRRC